MVLTAYFALSPVSEFLLSPSLADMDCLSPVGPTRLREFNTSNGCQDHTTSPSAHAPFVSAPLIAHGKPALPSRHTPNAAASTASRPASVTIAIRPSVGRDGGGYRSDLGQVRTGIFLQRGLDRRTTEQPVGQINTVARMGPTGRREAPPDDRLRAIRERM
jgi:hypothetical protein